MKQAIYEYLNQQGILYTVTEHVPVYTMEDMEALGLHKLGIICKNLFLRDAKGKRHYLVVTHVNTQIDLKHLGEATGAGKVSFASNERLQKYLGSSPGCVSPMGLLNDSEHAVSVLLDKRLEGEAKLGIHPNENNATLWISWEDLCRMILTLGNPLKIYSF